MHSHADSHDHAHHAHANRKRLIFALAITSTILLAEIIGAAWIGSLSLLVDAGHMLTDTAGLAMALVAAHLATKESTSRHTWGYARSEVLAATAQAAVLLGVGIYVMVEAIHRFTSPPEIASTPLLVFGVVGLAGNLISMAILMGGKDSNLNMRAAFLEVVNDALGSVAVIVAAICIRYTGWTGADAVAGIIIGILIIPRAVRILRSAVSILMEEAPEGLNIEKVRTHLEELDHVISVHDLHASVVASGLPVMSAHVVVKPECFYDGHAPKILEQLQECAAEHFPVPLHHATFQLEPEGHDEHEILDH